MIRPDQTELDIVILAAGRSARFGSDKRLLTLRKVLTVTTHSFKGMSHRIYLVLREEDQLHLPELLGEFLGYPTIQPVFSSKPDRGMGANLALAAILLKSPVAMVLLADMPFISGETLVHLFKASSRDIIVAPAFHGQRGHPVLFGHRFYPDLEKLDGEAGGKVLIDQHPDNLLLVSVEDEGVVKDVDFPEDWETN